MFAAQPDVGDGVIDNIIVSPSLHQWWGAFTVAALVVAAALLTFDVYKRQSASTRSRWAFAVAGVALVVQALVGIKLLDQGSGFWQLYIHYIGGLLPLGVFLVGGWFARGDTVRSARVLLVLLWLGVGSAAMAYSIGQAYSGGLA